MRQTIADVVDTGELLVLIRDTIGNIMERSGTVITRTERESLVDRIAREVTQVVIHAETLADGARVNFNLDDRCGNCDHRLGDHAMALSASGTIAGRCLRFDGRRDGCPCAGFATLEHSAVVVNAILDTRPDGRRLSDTELSVMVRDQIRAEFGPAVEFGSGTAGDAIEAMMIRQIHLNRRQFDMLTPTGTKKQ
jgi:hypothetical protein